MSLALSLVALALGPFLYAACQNSNFLRSALDGLLFVTIAGIVVVHIIPDVYAVAGITALLFLVSGVAVAFLVERLPTNGGGDRYGWIIAFGAIGLAMHAAMDGIALLPLDQLSGSEAGSHDGHAHLRPEHGSHDHSSHDHGEDSHRTGLGGLLSNHLAIGVILHRIPVGMAIWWVVRPRLGRAVAIGALAIIAISTSAAYLLGEPVVALMEARSVACFQAFVAGTLLHVIVLTPFTSEKNSPEPFDESIVIGERLGILAGIVMLFLVPHAH